MRKRELAHILPWRSGLSKKILQISSNQANRLKNGMKPWAMPFERTIICHADGGGEKKK